jgi:hypothetical protein
MNYDQLARGYDPRNRVEEGYAYNPAQQQEKFHPGAIQGAQLGEQRKQSGVTREMQQLEKNLHVLAAAIDNLENRLASACLPIPETASGLRTSDGGGCALANQLAGFNSMLLSQITRIEMLYQGVDL